MSSLRLCVVVAVFLAQVAGALAAGEGKPSKRPRLGTFEGARVENATVAGRREPAQTAYPVTTFRVSKGRLYVTMRPLNQLKRPNPWRQSFKILTDEWQGDERVITYERDANPVARRNNERAIDATYDGTARLRGMSGSGRVHVTGKAAQWSNVGDGELLINYRAGQLSARYDWSESFAGVRGIPSLKANAASRPAPALPPHLAP